MTKKMVSVLPSYLTKGIAGYVFRFTLAILASVAAYSIAEFVTLRLWDSNEYLIVEVAEIGRETLQDSGSDIPFQAVNVELMVWVLTGEQKGKLFSIVATQAEDGGPELKKGRQYVLVSDVFEDGSTQYSISDVFRVPSVISVIVLSCACLVAFAGRAGAMALLGLTLSLACLLWGYVPLAAKGVMPLPAAFIVVFLISLITIFCVVRRKQARTVALLGTLGGIGGALVIGYFIVDLWQLSGLAGEGASLLATTLSGMDMRGILLASVLIAAAGAVMDVGISITAAMSELVEYDATIRLSRLFAAGIRVGTEILGSMINTLILAYLGSSLPMAILISNAGADFLGLLNDPYVGQEIVQSLAGTAGLVLTIPITATFFVFHVKLSRRKIRGYEEV